MKYLLGVILLVFISCSGENFKNASEVILEKEVAVNISSKDSINIDAYYKKAWDAGMYSTKYQTYLDSALMIKPDSAYLWQQKAMPLYKARKYSVGKPFLEKAVKYNPEGNLDYSGFMKCIFSKDYEESIAELLEAKKRFGDSYVMDHTYNFYIGLDYLQLNQFDKAKEYLIKSKEQQFLDFPNDSPEEACHYLDWFYLGLVEDELKNYEVAIEYFNMSLKVYKNFGDAMYYKAYSQLALNRVDEAKSTYEKAFENNQNTINEDNVFYEVYPYQIFHRLSPMSQSEK
jgi:tetratricopeptide (TPR) repeat protein